MKLLIVWVHTYDDVKLTAVPEPAKVLDAVGATSARKRKQQQKPTYKKYKIVTNTYKSAVSTIARHSF
ncbi:hypothetical protein BV375_23905 [Nostoc sp. 106C]|nr:hypothetical protein BV375_23905 [Nostoc sp. 106C]